METCILFTLTHADTAATLTSSPPIFNHAIPALLLAVCPTRLRLITEGLPSEAADSNVILWQANVPAGTYAW